MAIVEIVPYIDVEELRRSFIKRRLPQSENWRNYYGRIDSMNVIESAIRQATDLGQMAALTDLESESMAIDPHLSGVMAKRCGAIRALEWDVVPPDAPDDPKAAREIAAEIKKAVAAIPDFKSALYDLEWAVFDGRSLLENHWDFNPARRMRAMVRQMSWVHPRRLSFGPARELRVVDTWRQGGMFSEDGLGVEEYSLGKFTWWTPRMFREYPEREGLGPRTLYWTFFKRFSWRMRMALTEIFGLPWRIVTFPDDPNVTTQSEEFDAAREAAEKLGGTQTAAFGRGAKMETVFPGDNSGNLFRMTNEDVDLQISKLVLGQTGTTDPTANRAESIVGKGEQDTLRMADSEGIEARIQQTLVVPLTRLNYGPDIAGVTPQFRLRGKPDRDRQKELERADKVISIGVPVAVSEIRDVAGFRPPAEDEAFVVSETDALGNQVTRVVDPEAEKAKAALGAIPGSQAADASVPTAPLGVEAVAVITKVNEARAQSGLPPLVLPDGMPDPRGELFVKQLDSMFAADALVPQVPGQMPPGQELPGVNHPEDAGNLTDDLDDEEAAAEDEADGLARTSHLALLPHSLAYGDPDDPAYPDEDEVVAMVLGVDLEDEDPGDEPVEEPEEEDEEWQTGPIALGRDPTVVQAFHKAARDGARIFSALVERLVSAIPERGGAERAHKAVSRAAVRLPMERLQKSVERSVIRAAMVGAAEAHWEMTNDATVTVAKEFELQVAQGVSDLVTLPVGRWETFDACVAHMQSEDGGGHDEESARKICGEIETKQAAGEGAPLRLATINVGNEFVRKPFEAAIRSFASKQVLSRNSFYRLVQAARKRAFTISGLARQEMLSTAHDEITKAIREGVSGRELRARMAERFVSAGWTPLKPSHVDLVYRNATMGAFAAGRHAQMTQPHVLKARPFWQWLGANDDASRPTHRALHAKVFEATDELWTRTHGGPPAGHNCRCRKVSRSQADLERLGLKVSQGKSFPDVPDEGWR